MEVRHHLVNGIGSDAAFFGRVGVRSFRRVGCRRERDRSGWGCRKRTTSRGPSADVTGTSSDDLTGVPLPGLSASPFAVELWWGDRPLRLWIARRLHDYSHLEHEKRPGVRPWVLEGRELGRGPDNEPLVRCDRPVA